MKKRNVMPLVMGTLLFGLIFIFSFLRFNQNNIWKDSVLNFDVVFSLLLLLWIIFESYISKEELSKGDKISDFGTLELYGTSQACVILSALWFTSIWKTPGIFHLIGFLIFLIGVGYRIWAIQTLGKYYSHIVREIKDHKIVDSGPYRFQRHPSYTGMIMAKIGLTIFFFNIVTLSILLLVLIPAIILRILIEEKTLYRIEGYSDFAQSRKRLFPGIW